MLDIGFLKNFNEFLIHSSLKIRHYSIWSLSNIIVSNEIFANKVFVFEDVFEKVLKILIVDEEIVLFKKKKIRQFFL